MNNYFTPSVFGTIRSTGSGAPKSCSGNVEWSAVVNLCQLSLTSVSEKYISCCGSKRIFLVDYEPCNYLVYFIGSNCIIDHFVQERNTNSTIYDTKL